MWNGIGWYGFIGPTTSTTDISLGLPRSLEKILKYLGNSLDHHP